MQIELSLIISIVSVSAAVIFGYLALKRNNTKDTEEAVEERATINARVLTKLDNISDTVNEIKRDNKDLREDLSKIKERVVVLEQKVG